MYEFYQLTCHSVQVLEYRVTVSLGFQTLKKLASAPALNEKPEVIFALPVGLLVLLTTNATPSSRKPSRLASTVAEAALLSTLIPKATYDDCEKNRPQAKRLVGYLRDYMG